MRYQERTYIQTPHTCVRNKITNIVSMSSDLCEFNEPTYGMTGATNIFSGNTGSTETQIITGVTSSDDFIHIVDSGTTFDLGFIFTGNVETFIDTDTSFKYNIYRYNANTNVFVTPPIFSSGDIEWSEFSGTSAFTDTLLTSEFIIDGEYLLKGSYEFTTCTNYLFELGDSNDTTLPLIGDYYNIYDSDFDNYFALIQKAIKPQFELTPTDARLLGNLTVESVLIDEAGISDITTSNTWAGSPIVSVNGLTLSQGEDEDFTTVGNTIFFNASLSLEDVITVAYVDSGNDNGLLSESIRITGATVSGTTDGEGSNLHYFNTDTGKYEIYTLSEPIDFNDLVVTLNGITLAETLDYSQSTVKSKRIILNGDIMSGDVITISYNSYGSFVGTIYTDNFEVYWTVSPAPLNTSGIFTAMVADDESFSAGTIIYSATTSYVTNESTYNIIIDLSGYTGTTAYYKINNQKDYTLITSDVVSTITDSDIIPITLQL